MADSSEGVRSLGLTPTWSVAIVLTTFVAISLAMERSIHSLSHWLQKTNRKPLFQAVDRMKEELMLLGFISLLIAATARMISNICVESKFYSGSFLPCSRSQVEDSGERIIAHRQHVLLEGGSFSHSFRRMLTGLQKNSCKEGYEPFVSYEGMEELHRFIFVMGVTHVFYSCLTMLLAIVKIYSWRKWEEEASIDRHDVLSEITRKIILVRQSTFAKSRTSKPWSQNRITIWMTCFVRQFGQAVVRSDYLTLRKGFLLNHNLPLNYDFHSYMVRSMEDEFKMIVGVSAPLWGFVVVYILFNINGSNLYFWIAIIPVCLVLLVGAKLQHIIATLALENAGVMGIFKGTTLKPRDSLFWFKKPELLLLLIHFTLFQNSFELASFFWFWWQFGYNSCFVRNHSLVYIRLTLGFAAQFLCSYSTLPLYALVTQMGSRYKAALIPERIRDIMNGWGKEARRKRKHGLYDESTIRTETSTNCSIEDDDQLDIVTCGDIDTQHDSELWTSYTTNWSWLTDEKSNMAMSVLTRSSTTTSHRTTMSVCDGKKLFRSASMPR